MKPLLLWLSVLLVTTLKAAPSLPQPEACHFYDQLEHVYACGPRGYPLGFGRKYCQRYVTMEKTPDLPRVQRLWIQGTRQCLKDILEDRLKPTDSCARIRRLALGSHVYCYTKGARLRKGVSICQLRLKTWKKVLGIVDPRDRRRVPMRRQGLQLAWRCGRTLSAIRTFLPDFF